MTPLCLPGITVSLFFIGRLSGQVDMITRESEQRCDPDDSSAEHRHQEFEMTDPLEKSANGSGKKPARSDDRLLVSRREAAARLSISERAVDYLIANRALTTKRIGSRVLIPIADLKRFANGDHPKRLAS